MGSRIVVVFAGDTTQLEAALARADAATGAATSKMRANFDKASASVKKFGEISALAFVGAATASVVAAAKFQQSMELLHTQAGASQQQVDALSKAALGMAGAVGQSPERLAESMYHVASTLQGVVPAAQLVNKTIELTRVAAQGAAISGADLVDTTNALTATMASGMKGTESMNGAMGALNATVGAGDMHFQDLNEALGSGMLAVVKTFGVNVVDTGAALATFGDNNVRGADAATMLVQAVRAFGVPAKTGKKALDELGLSQDTLAKDMQTGGLNKAIQDLHDRLVKTGNTGAKSGQLLTEAFGKKAGNGIAVLLDQFDRFEEKYRAVDAGAKKFDDAWAATTKTLAFQFKSIVMALDGWATTIGTKLIPKIQELISWGKQHEGLLKNIAIAFGIAATAAALFWAASMAPAALAIGAVTGIILAVETMYQKFVWFRDLVKLIWADIQVAVAGAIDVLKVDFVLWGTAIKVTWDSVIYPTIKAFAATFLVAAAEIVNGAAKAFGWVPGIGPKLKNAADAFNQFAYDVNGALGNIVDYKHITVQVDMIAGSRASDQVSNMTAGKIAGAKAAGLAAIAAQAKSVGAAIPKAVASGITGGGGGGGAKTNPIADALKQAVSSALTKVQDLKKQMADAGKQIADGLVSGAGGIAEAFKTSHGDLFTYVLGKGLVKQSDGGWIAAQMQSKAAQMVAFAGKIRKLRAMGLNGATLAEVVNAGSAVGSQMADALLGDKATISSLNSSEATLQSAAGSIGSSMAAGQYDAQILAAIRELVQLQKETPAQYAKALQTASSAAYLRAKTVTG